MGREVRREGTGREEGREGSKKCGREQGHIRALVSKGLR